MCITEQIKKKECTGRYVLSRTDMRKKHAEQISDTISARAGEEHDKVDSSKPYSDSKKQNQCVLARKRPWKRRVGRANVTRGIQGIHSRTARRKLASLQGSDV